MAFEVLGARQGRFMMFRVLDYYTTIILYDDTTRILYFYATIMLY